RRISSRSLPQFPRAARLVPRPRRGIYSNERLDRKIFARRRKPHQRRFRSAETRMVQHAISAKAPDRGTAPRSRKRIEAQRLVETGVARRHRGRPGWKRPRLVFTYRGFVAAPSAVAAGFFFVVARV